jgi:SAM-dependent methyltransferase
VIGLRSLVKRHPGLKRAALALSRLSAPALSPLRPSALLRYPGFIAERRRYLAAGGDAPWLDSWPCLFDRSSTSGIDAHYFHQAVWAARQIAARRPPSHVDIGSDTLYVGMLTALTRVTFVDIRPLELHIADYTGVNGSILDLPFADASVQSLSCLHVIEHIGLGRYGDPLDPQGSVKAAREIVRVLAPGGHAYVSMPIGRARVQFNGQRVFDPREVPGMFDGLVLDTFAVVDATGTFIERADPQRVDLREAQSGADSGLGMFAFTRASTPADPA